MRSNKKFDEKFKLIRKLFNFLEIIIINNSQQLFIFDANVACVF